MSRGRKSVEDYLREILDNPDSLEGLRQKALDDLVSLTRERRLIAAKRLMRRGPYKKTLKKAGYADGGDETFPPGMAEVVRRHTKEDVDHG